MLLSSCLSLTGLLLTSPVTHIKGEVTEPLMPGLGFVTI
jgi:hypothetical protein